MRCVSLVLVLSFWIDCADRPSGDPLFMSTSFRLVVLQATDASPARNLARAHDTS